MRFAYVRTMPSSAQTEAAIARWHEVVNAADLDAARTTVGDPIVVNGPKGAGPITPASFCDWITRSGIRLHPRSYHPISDHVLVVEQDATWPQDPKRHRVATVFRAYDSRVTAALRFPSLRDALHFADLYSALAATEPSTGLTIASPR